MSITGVGCVDSEGLQRRTFGVGESMAIRIRYVATSPLVDPAVAVSIHRMDGIRVCHLISARDGCSLGRLEGEGTVILHLDHPNLGPGEFVLSVGFFERLDLLDRIGPEPLDLHDRAYEFTIDQPLECALDLGVTLPIVRWESRYGR